jgi:hypothetical protein
MVYRNEYIKSSFIVRKQYMVNSNLKKNLIHQIMFQFWIQKFNLVYNLLLTVFVFLNNKTNRI